MRRIRFRCGQSCAPHADIFLAWRRVSQGARRVDRAQLTGFRIMSGGELLFGE